MRRTSAVLVAILVALAASAEATTLRDPGDAVLAEQADVIVEGTVTAIATVRTVGGRIETYVDLGQVTALKGTVPDPVTLVQPGGDLGPACGEPVCALVIPGSPSYSVGEHVVVMAEQDATGALHTLDLALGKFTVNAQEVTRGLDKISSRRDRREAQAFRAELRAAGQQAPKHLRPLRQPTRRDLTVHEAVTVQQFALFNNVRWFAPDRGQPVRYFIDQTGDAKVGPAASTAGIEAAFKAWTDVSSAAITIQSAGPSDASGGFCDGTSKIVFNDPASTITDPNGCGGILAVGGYCAGGATATVNGTVFREVIEGDIIFNNGWSPCSFWNATNMAEVATHELGHTLGLAHSEIPEATMYAYAHFDGRGASLKPDDVAGISAIYPVGAPVPPPVPTSTPQPTTTPTISSSTLPRTTAVPPPPYALALTVTHLTGTRIRATVRATTATGPTNQRVGFSLVNAEGGLVRAKGARATGRDGVLVWTLRIVPGTYTLVARDPVGSPRVSTTVTVP